jgi:hypothetical protein
VSTRRLHRYVDETLLAIAMQAGLWYLRRRMRRAARRAAMAGLSAAGIGAAGIAAAAAAAWIATVLFRRRSKRAEVPPPSLDARWRANGAGVSPDAAGERLPAS